MLYWRGRGGVAQEVAALFVRSLEDVDDGLFQATLSRLLDRLEGGVRLGASPSRYCGGFA